MDLDMGLSINKHDWGIIFDVDIFPMSHLVVPGISWHFMAFLVGEGPLQLEHVPVPAVCYQAVPAQGAL